MTSPQPSIGEALSALWQEAKGTSEGRLEFSKALGQMVLPCYCSTVEGGCRGIFRMNAFMGKGSFSSFHTHSPRSSTVP